MKRIHTLVLFIIAILVMLSACNSALSNDTENQPSSSAPTENTAAQSEIVTEDNIPEEPISSDGDNDESKISIIDPAVPTAEATAAPELSAIPTPESTSTPAVELPPTPSSTPELTVGDEMVNISITIGSAVFSAKLYSNDTTNALLELFPLTVDMSELNGNEKYYYLLNSLPTDSQRLGSIHAGDLMLYGSDCLVLFYESFNTSYSYTKLGYIENVSGLVTALGSGSVLVTFNAEN